MSSTPHGWKLLKLRDIATLKTGPFGSALHKADYIVGGIPLINPTHIKDGKLAPSIDVSVSPETAERLSDYQLNKGDIVMGRRGEMGRCAVVPEHAQDWLCGTGSVVVKSTFAAHPKYLQRFLTAPATVAALIGDSVGSTMINLNQGVLLGLDIPLAPLPEQKRIADKLDSVLARVDACRDRLDRLPALLKRFRQSILAAATSGRLTEDWRTQHQLNDMALLVTALPSTQKARRGVSDTISPASEYTESWATPSSWWKGTAASLLCKGVLHDLKDGNHGANHPVVSDFTDNGLAFITAAQVDRFTVDYDGAYKISGQPLEKLRVGFAQTGDVVLTHKGSVGRVGMIDRDCVLTPQTTYYRANLEYVLPKFLMYYMASQPFSGQLDEIKSQTTRDFVPITQQYALVHILPPLPEQTEIVRRVELLFAFADRLETRLAAARRQVGQLTPAFLAKAFRGELVPQDPADEPAAELLKRLATQREAAPKTRRGRAGKA